MKTTPRFAPKSGTVGFAAAATLMQGSSNVGAVRAIGNTAQVRRW
ncbi:MAG TPA: hypothetical protein VE779_00820 [Candidatus Angelobacter sp.]|nr:hypothetical protein [Candidatus Angelobacter sp.]